MHCNNSLNNKLVETVVKNKVAQETEDLKYLQDSMRAFIATIKEIILGEYSPEFFNTYVDEALKLHGSSLEEFLNIPKMGFELKEALFNIDKVINNNNQTFKNQLTLLLDKFQSTLDDMEYVARDPYDTAVELGFQGSKQEWLDFLRGDSAYETALKHGFRGSEQDWLDSFTFEQDLEVARIDQEITSINQTLNDSGNAASRVVGTESNQIPEASLIKFIEASHDDGGPPDNNFDNALEAGRRYVRRGMTLQGMPPSDLYSGTTYQGTIEVLKNHQNTNTDLTMQLFIPYGTGTTGFCYRQKWTSGWQPWQPISDHPANYKRTTSENPNLYVDSAGRLLRSTSSMKYKDMLGSLELSDEMYEKALNVKPIIYRSKSEADPSHWHFISFSAEELGEHDPALTQWKTHDYNDEGELIELEEKEAEGINLHAICAVLHATNIKQDELIQSLEDRVKTLENALDK